MAKAAGKPTGGDHQKPYPHLIFGHVSRAIEAHLALTIPPEPDDTGVDSDEGGDNAV